MKLHWFVAVLGGLMVGAAVILGSLAGVSVAGPGGGSHIDTIACGTGWGGGGDIGSMNAAMWYDTLSSPTGLHNYSADCDAAVSTRLTWTWALLGVGGVLAVGGLVVRGARRPEPASSP